MEGWSVFLECENLGDRKLTGLAISEHYCACPATKQLPPTLILPLPICITAPAHSLIGPVSGLVPLLQVDAGMHKASGLGYFTSAAALH